MMAVFFFVTGKRLQKCFAINYEERLYVREPVGIISQSHCTSYITVQLNYPTFFRRFNILKVFDHNPADRIKTRKISRTMIKEIVKIADYLDNA